MNLERILLRKPHGNTLCFLCFPQMRRIVAQGCIQEHHIYSNLLIRDCFFRPTNEVLLVRLSWRNRYIAYGIITISKFQMRIYPNGVNRRRSFIALNWCSDFWALCRWTRGIKTVTCRAWMISLYLVVEILLVLCWGYSPDTVFIMLLI